MHVPSDRYFKTGRPFAVLLLALISLVLVQCGDEYSGNPKLFTAIETRDQFETPVDTFSPSENITLTLIVKNLRDRSISLDVTSQLYEFVVTDGSGGSVVWQWSLGKGFPAVMNTIDFAPGEIKEFEVVWDQTDNNGLPVIAGIYRAQGFLADPDEFQRGLISERSETRSCLRPFAIN